MRNIRIYTDTPLAVSARIILSKEASHHLLRVLRCRRNDDITLFNGHGGSYTGRIISDSTRVAEVEILGFEPETSEPALCITLGLGISRSLHMDYAIQKSVELGVSAIVPLFTERSNVKLDHKRAETRLQHWEIIMVHACEQSGRNTLPILHTPRSLHEWVSNDQNTTRFLLAPSARQSLVEYNGMKDRDISILVGPEGGLTDSEQTTAEKLGYIPIKLGSRTLRTETAVVAAITALQVLWGDLR